MAADTQVIANLLEGTFDPRRNKEAEAALRVEESKESFSLRLLQIVATDSYSYTTRLASALCFKNFVKRNWTDADGKHKLPPAEVAAIKHELIGLMIASPSGVQAQLGEAISLIAESDFFRQWDTLMDDLVSRLTPNDARANNGVLEVAHSICKRWRPLFRSDELFTEILHVLEKFGPALLKLFETTDQMIEASKDNKEQLHAAFGTLNLLVKLFYDLSCQDLPPIFEENLAPITMLLHKYFTYDNPLLHTSDDAESGPLEFVKAGICEVLVLYIQKYEDAFGAFVDKFIQSAWELLTTTGTETKYDILVSKALQFLTAVARISQHAQNFKSEEVLGLVVDKVILPNLSLRESDIELFEDEPIEFIRRDLEGSDSDTRRRAATDFLRQLMEQFEELVTGIVMKYVQHYLAEFAKDPRNNWKFKDTAVYLFSSIAAKGTVTASQGVKSTNALVNVVDFFQQNIGNDLMTEENVEPMLKVDAIKYLYIFRSQITKEQWQSVFPVLVKHLSSPHYVVYSYAAIAIERVLYLTDNTGQPLFKREDVLPMAQSMLQQLLRLIQQNPAPDKMQENEFLMRCIMRVLLVIRDGVIPMTGELLKGFIDITNTISQGPGNPRFYYYNFEALGAIIRFAAPSEPTKMEQTLYPPFEAILQQDVEQFVPYILQLFAALLEANPSGPLPDYYKALIPAVLTPTLWETKGNVPALVRLLSAMIVRGTAEIAANNQIEPVLGIFQMLISKKANEGYGFDLIETVISSFPVSTLQPYFIPLFNMMFLRLQNSRTENFAVRFVHFYHFMSSRDKEGLGTDFVVNIAEQVQKDIFPKLYLSIILPETNKLIRPLDRKTAIVSFCKTLTESMAFAQRYEKGWGYTAEGLIKLLDRPSLAPTTGNTSTTTGGAGGVGGATGGGGVTMEEIQEQDVDDVNFDTNFTQLNTCRRKLLDPWPLIGDLKSWVGNSLRDANGRNGGKIEEFIKSRTNEQVAWVLFKLMQDAPSTLPQ